MTTIIGRLTVTEIQRADSNVVGRSGEAIVRASDGPSRFVELQFIADARDWRVGDEIDISFQPVEEAS